MLILSCYIIILVCHVITSHGTILVNGHAGVLCVAMTGHLISSMVIMMWHNGFEWLFEDPHNCRGSLSCLMSSFDMLYAHLDVLQVLSGHLKLNNGFNGSS